MNLSFITPRRSEYRRSDWGYKSPPSLSWPIHYYTFQHAGLLEVICLLLLTPTGQCECRKYYFRESRFQNFPEENAPGHSYKFLSRSLVPPVFDSHPFGNMEYPPQRRQVFSLQPLIDSYVWLYRSNSSYFGLYLKIWKCVSKYVNTEVNMLICIWLKLITRISNKIKEERNIKNIYSFLLF